VDELKSTSDLTQEIAEASTARLESLKALSEQSTAAGERALAALRLERDQTSLAGAVANSETTIRTLQFEIARRTVRAGVGGIIADLVPAPPGTLVTAGQSLASVVPAGNYRVVAQYTPAEAIARVRPGQPAVVRLDGFPWTQYGVHHAIVTQVASEPRGSFVRVELAISEPSSTLPLTHGLTGSVEIEVDRVSPLVLGLRSLGYFVTSPLRSEMPPQAPKAEGIVAKE
jgi:adhesin transport system membrane fusion protein